MYVEEFRTEVAHLKNNIEALAMTRLQIVVYFIFLFFRYHTHKHHPDLIYIC